ncbi:hypothetical protein BKA63DRAFT_519775 [Paraphoma chrysanthemicola]|nr:hypothetical protein BKA63DRAFT_519775 [Paraphoma chrysanthemicola]
MASSVSFDWCDEKFVDYDPGASHEYMEVSMTASGLNVFRELVAGENLAARCKTAHTENESTEWRLRCLITQRGSYTLRSPYSEEIGHALDQCWHVSVSDLTFRGAGGARLTATSSLLDLEVHRFSSRTVPCYSLVISHLRSERETRAVLFSTNGWFQSSGGLESLMSMASYGYQPHLVPFILVAHTTTEAENFVYGGIQQSFESIRATLGCDTHFAPEQVFTLLDFTNLPQAIMALSNATTDLEHLPDAMRDQIDLVSQLMDNFPDAGSNETGIHMRKRLQILRCRIKNLESYLNRISTSAQSMTQMVYATLQQRDNDLNRRYAADMRVITAITLVFLPGTFVATLFSASFWNFDPRTSGPLVSKWVWLYFFMTVALTLIVLGVWRGYTALKQSFKFAKNAWRNGLVLRWLTRAKNQSDEENRQEGPKDK